MKKKLYVAPCAKVVNLWSEGHIASGSQTGGGGHLDDNDEGAKNEIDMENEW